MVERLAVNQDVAGSSPAGGAKMRLVALVTHGKERLETHRL